MDGKTKLIVDFSALAVVVGVLVICVAWNIRKVNRTGFISWRAPQNAVAIAWLALGCVMYVCLMDLGLPENIAGGIAVFLWIAAGYFADKIIKKKTKEARDYYIQCHTGPFS